MGRPPPHRRAIRKRGKEQPLRKGNWFPGWPHEVDPDSANSLSGGRCCGRKSRGAPGTLYSYGARYTFGNSPEKLPCGGGEGVAHSRVVAFHGLSDAGRPFFRLTKKL